MEDEKKELEREIQELIKIKNFIDDTDLPHYKIVHLLQEISNKIAINKFEISKLTPLGKI